MYVDCYHDYLCTAYKMFTNVTITNAFLKRNKKRSRWGYGQYKWDNIRDMRHVTSVNYKGTIQFPSG